MRNRPVENIGAEFGSPLFEIAAYRVSPRRWAKEREELRETARSMVLPSVLEVATPEQIQRLEDRLMDSPVQERGGFPYAQVIGWLRIIHDGPGPSVKAYTYKLPQKRFQRRFRQERYDWRGMEFELNFDYSRSSSLDIADDIRGEIARTTAKGGSLQGRWLDLACFDYMAMVIDWRGRLGLPRL